MKKVKSWLEKNGFEFELAADNELREVIFIRLEGSNLKRSDKIRRYIEQYHKDLKFSYQQFWAAITY